MQRKRATSDVIYYTDQNFATKGEILLYLSKAFGIKTEKTMANII